MENKLFRIQKKVGLLCSGIGFAVTAINYIYLLGDHPPVKALADTSVSVVFAFGLFFLVSSWIDSRLIRFTQILFLLFSAAIAILDEFDSFYGLGFMALAIALAFKYRYFETRPILKLSLFGFLLFGLTEISVLRDPSYGSLAYGLEALIFLTLLLAFLYLIFQEEIREYREYIKKLNNPIDLRALGVTHREEDVLRVFVRNSALTDQEIGYELGMATNTVKTHMVRLRKKTNTSSKTELGILCQNINKAPRQIHRKMRTTGAGERNRSLQC